MRKHEHTAALGLSHFWPSAVRTLHDACNRRQNKCLLSQHGPGPSCSRKTNKHGLKPDPLKNFKYFWIYFPWGSWYNQRGQFSLEKENIEEILLGKLVISEKGWLPHTAACHFQTHAAFTDLHSACTSLFSQSDWYSSVLPDCRAGLPFPCPLKPKRYAAKPRSPVCSWHRGQKKGRKRSTSLIDTRTKTNLEKNCSGGPRIPTPDILLMWLKAACQPNLIWIYIQRKCLV